MSEAFPKPEEKEAFSPPCLSDNGTSLSFKFFRSQLYVTKMSSEILLLVKPCWKVRSGLLSPSVIQIPRGGAK